MSVSEEVAKEYVKNMSLDELKQFVYEDLIELHNHTDEDLLLANFWDLPEVTREIIKMKYPDFDTGEQ